jgi:8-oxo-dGTP pyrophosphatase MutT (NUDIX family)
MPEILSNTIEICLFRFRRDRPEYLLLKRAAGEQLYPGLWQVVTGSVRTGEKGLEAAVREVIEETALRPQHFWIVPSISGFYDHVRDAISLIPSFAGQVGPDENPHLSEEHDGFEWLPRDRAIPRLVWPGQRNLVETVDRSIVGGEIAGLLTLVPPESIP